MGSCPSYSLWDSLAIARLACTLAHDSLHFVLVLYVFQVGHKPAEPVRAVTPRTHCYFPVCKIKGAGDSVLEGGLWVGLEGLGRLCVWHRCEQPVGHPLAMAPAWPVCHMQSSCLPGGAWLWAGTAHLLSRHLLGTVGKWRVVALPLGSHHSIQATSTSISDDLAGRAARHNPGQLQPSRIRPVLRISSSTQGVQVGRDAVPPAVCALPSCKGNTGSSSSGTRHSHS